MEEVPIEALYEEKHIELRQQAELSQIEVYTQGTIDTSPEVEKYRLIASAIVALHDTIKAQGPPTQTIIPEADLQRLRDLVGLTDQMRTKLSEARGHRDRGEAQGIQDVDFQQGIAPGLAQRTKPKPERFPGMFGNEGGQE